MVSVKDITMPIAVASKWGNSLAIRLPAAVVEALGLKEGDRIEIHAAGKRSFEIGKTPGARECRARDLPLNFSGSGVP